MPIESLQSRAPVTAYATGEGATTALPAGTIEARVTAILENGIARFATAFGFVDLATPEQMSIGARAQLLVENTGIRILLTQLGTASTASGGAPAGTQTAATASNRPLPSAPPFDPVATQLASAARSATATQQSPAALLSRLVPLLAQSTGALPPDVQRAAAQLLSLPLRADQALDPAVLQAAMRQSGLFREAKGETSGRPDWKQALVALRGALSAWSPQAADMPSTAAQDTADAPEGTPPRPPTSGPATPGTAADAGAAARLLASAASRVTRGGADATAALMAGGQDGPDPAAPPRTAPAGAGTPESLLIGDETALASRAASPAMLGQLVARAFGATLAATAGRPAGPMDGATEQDQPGTVVGLPSRDRVVPPRADQPPRTLPPETAPDQWLQADPATQRDTLLALTEGALDRVRLSQFASLPREQPAAQQAQPQVQQQPAWVFDVPVFVGRETAVAQFRVSKDGRGAGAGGGSAERWSMDVAIDTSETGPVHARVRLGGGAIGITLWAERPDMVERLKTEMPDLRRTLDAAAFTVDDLSILPGSPQAQAVRASGYFLDTRS